MKTSRITVFILLALSAALVLTNCGGGASAKLPFQLGKEIDLGALSKALVTDDEDRWVLPPHWLLDYG